MRRVRGAVGAGVAAALLASCGGGGSGSGDPTTTASTAAAPASSSTTAATPATLGATAAGALRTSLGAALAALDASFRGTDPAIAASDLTAAKAAGRTGRDGLFAYDAQLRQAPLPDAAAPARNDVLAAIGQAIAAFDQLGAAPDAAAFATARQQVPAKVQAFYAAQDALNRAVGLPPTRELQPSATGGSSTTTTARAPRTPITDAAAFRDRLLAAAKGSALPQGRVAAWQPFTSEVGFTGSARPATATEVSGFTFVSSKSKGVGFLAFAVADSAGRCAAGVLEASGDGSTVTSAAAAPAPQGGCSGSAVGEAAGY